MAEGTPHPTATDDADRSPGAPAGAAPVPVSEDVAGDARQSEPSQPVGGPGPTQNGMDRADANTAGDNLGQLVQDAVIYGGVHYHGATSESVAFSEETTRLVRETRRVDPQRVATIRATFVPPAGYPAFADHFRGSRVGVVTGKPGSGRATAAIHALDSSGLEIQEVSSEISDPRSGPERLPAEPGYAYLLDITPLGDPGAHHARVREYGRRVRLANARLIVIAESWNDDPADGYAFLPILPPAVDEVFLRHLTYLTSRAEAQRWMAEPEVRELLRGQSLASASRMAKRVQGLRPANPTLCDADFAGWVDTILGIFKDYENDVRQWFEAHEKQAARAEERRHDLGREMANRAQPERREELRPGDYQRVLIEAVAVLEGCPSDAVMLQVDELARHWDVPVQLPSPISGGGLTAMLDDLGAAVDTDDRVRFDKPGFGDVVLDHLWREYPKARQPLLTWSNGAVLDIPPKERNNVAQRWLQLAERQGDPKPVKGLLVAWGGNNRLRAAVVPVVAQAAVHDELGPTIRQYLYRLAVERRAGPGLDIAVAQVCGQYGKAEPYTALVRLSWVADRADGEVAGELHRALDAIWDEPAHRAVVLRALIDWESDERQRDRAGFARRYLQELFGRVGADDLPALLTEATRSPSELPWGLVGEGMAATLTGSRRPTREAVLDTWFAAFDGCAFDDEMTRALDQILLKAAASHSAASVRIGRGLYEWGQDLGGRHAVSVAERVSAVDPLRSMAVPTGGEPG